MEGAYLEVFPVFRGDLVAWAAGVFFRDVDVFAGKAPGDPGQEWQLLPEEVDASFLQVGRVVVGDFQFLLELLDVRSTVDVSEHAGEMLDEVGVMVCSVV